MIWDTRTSFYLMVNSMNARCRSGWTKRYRQVDRRTKSLVCAQVDPGGSTVAWISLSLCTFSCNLTNRYYRRRRAWSFLRASAYIVHTYDLTTLTLASEGTDGKKKKKKKKKERKKGNKVDGPKTGPHGGGTVIFKYRLRSGCQIERRFSSSRCWGERCSIASFRC